jgi:uncharacterized Fe-S cluster-containing radical SAM superfamily protein
VIAQAKHIDTLVMSEQLRARAIDLPTRKLLISRLSGSAQEPDLTVPSNCKGYGRIRHFRQQTSPGWPVNPLPMVPACKALGMEAPLVMKAQVFQNAACAWRCWYCFVPYKLLSADPKHSEWMTAEDLVRMYQSEQDRPLVIDLSGGSPDLVPEWTLWMMEALTGAGLDQTTYLWSDDNLSTTFLFDKLTERELERMLGYHNYGRVCCFKGFDSRSFAFNTHAAEADFDQQFEIMRRLLELGLDLYGYVTFTAPEANEIDTAVRIFVDRLQALDPNLPLRVVPLEIREFSPVTPRMDDLRRQGLVVQVAAIAAWQRELEGRFPSHLRSVGIADIPLRGKGSA